jgi:type VI secretion system protein ImpF
MAELQTQDRLQPALLDRLIDDEPQARVESTDKRVFTLSRLRESVLRDINWLFNTTQMAGSGELENYPLVASSVVNYGIPAFSGTTASSVDLRTVEIALRQAIVDFEPRLLADGVRVRARRIQDDEHHHNRLSFDIECRLWAQPAPIALLLHTDVDLESGQNAVTDSGRR